MKLFKIRTTISAAVLALSTNTAAIGEESADMQIGPPRWRDFSALSRSWGKALEEKVLKTFLSMPAAKTMKGVVNCTFRVAWDGSPSDLFVVSCDNPAANATAMDAIKRASPFFFPPSGILGQRVLVTLAYPRCDVAIDVFRYDKPQDQDAVFRRLKADEQKSEVNQLRRLNELQKFRQSKSF